MLTFVRPTGATISAVSEWLSEHGLTAKNVSPGGDLLEITLPVSKANTLLATQFSSFTHVASGKSSIRTLAYSVPATLQAHIQYVHPTVLFVPPLSGVPSVTAIEVSKREPVEERAAPGADAVPASCASIANPVFILAILLYANGGAD
jgi:tripeptidyl-peptidase-1